MTQFDTATRASAIIARPTLAGGISQQPAATRFPGTVEDAANVDFDLFDGMRKRAGTVLTRKITGLVKSSGGPSATLNAGGDYRVHPIRRSEAEQYLVFYGKDELAQMRVWPLEEGGPPALVTYGTGVETYLNSGSATPADLRFVTIADGTLIVNTKVATGLLTSPSYTLERTYKDADVMVASGPANGTYHRALLDGTDLDAGYYLYDIGTKTFATYTNTPPTWTGWAKLRGGDWDDAGKDPKSFRVWFRRLNLSNTGLTAANPSADGVTWTLTKAGAFTNYTREDGDQIRLTAGTGFTYGGGAASGMVTVLSRDSNDQITVKDAAGTNYTAGASCAMAATVGSVSFDGIGREYELSRSFASLIASGDIEDMDDVASEWTQAFRDLGEADATVGWVPNSAGYGAFRITSPWQGVDSLIIMYQSLVGTAGNTDLSITSDTSRPFSSGSASSIVISAGADSDPSPDGLTVRLPITSRWTRKPAPSQPEYQPDPAKMPVLMARNTFAGDGSTAATFTINRVDWTVRDTGDEETNAAPELFRLARPITAIALHEGRLTLGGGEYVTMSEAGNFYNFYKVDDVELADSDRIEKLIPGESVATVWAIKPLRRSMLVTTNAAKAFEVFADGAWTPSSVQVEEAISNELLNVEPVAMDSRLYVPARQHSPRSGRIASSVLEYAYDDGRGFNTPYDVTEHVPLFFEDNIRRMATVAAQNLLLVLNNDELKTLYVLRVKFSAGNQRQQLAWTKYTFNDNIADMALLTSGLHLVFENGTGGYTQEYLRFEPDITSLGKNPGLDSGDFPRRLDRSIAVDTSVDGVYDAGNNWTTWTVKDPYGVTLTTNDYDCVVKNDGTELTVTRPSTSTVRATGDHTAAVGSPTSDVVRIGTKYAATCKLSRDYVRAEGTNLPIPSHGYYVTYAYVLYRRCGAFDWIVRRPSAMGDVTRTFTPPGGTAIEEEGVAKFVGGGPNSTTTFEWSSTNSRPTTITSIQFLGNAANMPR
jgi:hypothetical protein